MTPCSTLGGLLLFFETRVHTVRNKDFYSPPIARVCTTLPASNPPDSPPPHFDEYVCLPMSDSEVWVDENKPAHKLQLNKAATACFYRCYNSRETDLSPDKMLGKPQEHENVFDIWPFWWMSTFGIPLVPSAFTGPTSERQSGTKLEELEGFLTFPKTKYVSINFEIKKNNKTEYRRWFVFTLLETKPLFLILRWTIVLH